MPSLPANSQKKCSPKIKGHEWGENENTLKELKVPGDNTSHHTDRPYTEIAQRHSVVKQNTEPHYFFFVLGRLSMAFYFAFSADVYDFRTLEYTTYTLLRALVCLACRGNMEVIAKPLI